MCSANQVTITKAVFGSADALFDNAWQNIVLTAMGLPGVLLAILWLRLGYSSRALQVTPPLTLTLALTLTQASPQP